jgi:hypothetical protein
VFLATAVAVCGSFEFGTCVRIPLPDSSPWLDASCVAALRAR